MSSKSALLLVLSTACAAAVALCVLAWILLSPTPPSVAGGTRLTYSLELDAALREGRITQAEYDDPNLVLRQTIEQLQQRIDPLVGPLRASKLGVNIRRAGGKQLRVEVPPNVDDANDEAKTIAMVREMIEVPFSFAIHMAASQDSASTGYDLDEERTKVAAWMKSNPQESLRRYNALLPEQGGPPHGLCWHLRRYVPPVEVGIPAPPLSERLTALQTMTGRERFGTEDIQSAVPSQGQLGNPALGLEIRDERQQDFLTMTTNHQGEAMAMVINDEVVLLATIRSPLPGEFIVEGGAPQFTHEQVRSYVRMIRSGELPVTLALQSEERIPDEASR